MLFLLSNLQRAFKSLCQSTHLYGRRLVLEWAEDDDTVDSIRQKTALHFNDGNLLTLSLYFYHSRLSFELQIRVVVNANP